MAANSEQGLHRPDDQTLRFHIPLRRNPHFYGRESDLLRIAGKFIHEPSEIPSTHPYGVCIFGPSGIGKTELVVEFCYRYRHLFQKIYWLQAEYDIPAQIARIGRNIGLPFKDCRLDEQVELTLNTWKESGPNLLVLDHIRDANVLLPWSDKLAEFPLIITSQSSSGWQENPEFQVQELAPFPKDASKDFLFHLAPRLIDQDEDTIGSMLELLTGLPQAINLAGRCMSGDDALTAKEYLTEITSARTVYARTIHGIQSAIDQTPAVPILALAYAVCWKKLKNIQKDDLSWKVFQACGYCAPNLSIPWSLLKECFSIDHKQKEEKLRHSLDTLAELGLLLLNNNEPIILSQLAEFSQWIENVSEEGSMLPRLSDSLSAMARYYNEQKQLSLMSSLQEHIQGIASASEKAGLKKTAGALNNSLGYHYWLIKDYDKARHFMEHSLKITEEIFGSDHSNVAAVVNNLGDVLLSQGQLPAARVCFENAIRIWEKTLGSEHLNVAKAASNLAGVMKRQGELYGAQTNLEKTLVILGKEFGTEHPRIIGTLNELGEILLELNEPDEAKVCFERTLAINEKDPSVNRLELARQAERIAGLLTRQGKDHEAQPFLEKAYKFKSELLRSEDPEFLETQNALLENLAAQGIITLPLDNENDASEIEYLLLSKQSLFQEYTAENARQLNRLGRKYLEAEKYSLAQRYHEMALMMLYVLPDTDRLLLADSTGQMAKILLLSGAYTPAEEHARQALSILEEVHGKTHPDILPVLSVLAEIERETDQLAQSEENSIRAIRILEEYYGPENSELSDHLNRMGSIHWARGEFREAQEYFERALKIDETAFGKQHPNVSRDMNNLGDALYRQNNLDEARQYFEQALFIEESNLGSEHPSVASVINNLAAVLWAQNSLDEARTLFERAYHIDLNHFGHDHLNVARDARNLGNLYKAMKNPDEAKNFFLIALDIRQKLLPANHPKIKAIIDSLQQLQT